MAKGDVDGSVVIELNAVVVAVTDDEPRILVIRPMRKADGDGLPYGPLDPIRHRTLESGLSAWVSEQTGLTLNYVEQLYTFADRFRDPRERTGGPRVVSIGYLALVRESEAAAPNSASWRNWYRHFPWEDWREGRPAVIDEIIAPRLQAWAAAADEPGERAERQLRTALNFGRDAGGWSDERVLERYELLYEAGLVAESLRDRGLDKQVAATATVPGAGMAADHRRIVATAIGRLRGKIKYRPLVFELMPPAFTLFQLQRVVEALAGARLHKQNFRRLVANTGLVEPTGRLESRTGGRPAEQFRFRPEVMLERSTPGVGLPRAARGERRGSRPG